MGTDTLAIIGSGNVGGALGKRLAGAGFEVVYGVRDDAARTKAAERLGPDARLLSMEAAGKTASVIFVATPAAAAPAVVQALGDLSETIVVDCTNPIRWDQGPVWTPPAEGSVAQQLAAMGTGARIVKAFNTFGAEFHADPSLPGGPVDVPIAGEADAVARVAAIAKAAGFAPLPAGPLRNAAVLENLAVLWIHLAMAEGLGRNVAFKLLSRD